MVGLSIVLEAQKCGVGSKTPKVINKTTMSVLLNNNNNKPADSSSSFSNSHPHHSPFQIPTFLDQCFLCDKSLSPGKDIYMYK